MKYKISSFLTNARIRTRYYASSTTAKRALNKFWDIHHEQIEKWYLKYASKEWQNKPILTAYDNSVISCPVLIKTNKGIWK